MGKVLEKNGRWSLRYCEKIKRILQLIYYIWHLCMKWRCGYLQSAPFMLAFVYDFFCLPDTYVCEYKSALCLWFASWISVYNSWIRMKKCLYEYVIWSRQLSERQTIYWKRSWGKPGVYLWSYPLPAFEYFLKPVYNCLFIFCIVLFILFCPCFSCLFCLYDVDRY